LQHSPQHNNNFDFLRFLFASFVIFTHSYALLGDIKADPLYNLSGRVFSEIGVCGFFVISGYLIHQSQERSSSVFSFARKRIVRIFPGLTAAVLVTALVIGAFVTTLPLKDYFATGTTWRYILDNVFLIPRQQMLPGVFAHNVETAVNGSLWTLRYELLFYGLLGLLFFVPKTFKKWLLPLLFLPGMYGYFMLKHHMSGHFSEGLHKFLLYCCNLGCYFVAGAMLSLLTPLLQARKTILLLISTILFSITLCFPSRHFEPLAFISFPVMVIAFGLHYSRVLHFSRYTGDISYGTYIYAYPLQQTLIIWLQPQNAAVLMLASFPVSWLAGYLSWHLVEKRFLRKR
jgi:peptidoglycan/LPS O-acetylase OafA/YrhL